MAQHTAACHMRQRRQLQTMAINSSSLHCDPHKQRSAPAHSSCPPAAAHLRDSGVIRSKSHSNPPKQRAPATSSCPPAAAAAADNHGHNSSKSDWDPHRQRDPPAHSSCPAAAPPGCAAAACSRTSACRSATHRTCLFRVKQAGQGRGNGWEGGRERGCSRAGLGARHDHSTADAGDSKKQLHKQPQHRWRRHNLHACCLCIVELASPASLGVNFPARVHCPCHAQLCNAEHSCAVQHGRGWRQKWLTGCELSGQGVVHAIGVVQDVVRLQLLVPRRLAHHLRFTVYCWDRQLSWRAAGSAMRPCSANERQC